MRKKVKDLDYYMNLRYEARIQKSEAGYFAEIPDLPGCMTFCDEFDQLEEMIEDAKKAWFEMSIEDNVEIPEPKEDKDFSGRFLLRLPKSLHRKLSNQAERDGVSLNQHILNLLSEESSALETVIKIKTAITDAAESEKVKQSFSSETFRMTVPLSPAPLRDAFGCKLDMTESFPDFMDVKAGSDTNKATADYRRTIQLFDAAEFSHHESDWEETFPLQFGSQETLQIFSSLTKVATPGIRAKAKSEDSGSERKRTPDLFLSYMQDRFLYILQDR
ncbi:MAG: toxin-antitoxin system HicB family antitoxin [Candidatus Dadabacteria bacterium]|nr:toxin-antitoxin system HicB family antitoxin [Candidatus Dadabacteria bacterium]MDE0520176.1 toxin-antitoxin system HicB family antitoxin [Candidatus Dadabacteria bacterium]MDE0663312.1 toxin-antitoxin system HicB family antitoxin [Candidatus Dadabacteria bacterium]